MAGPASGAREGADAHYLQLSCDEVVLSFNLGYHKVEKVFGPLRALV